MDPRVGARSGPHEPKHQVGGWSVYSLPFALISAMLCLYLSRSTASYESPALLFALNFVFTTLIAVFIAALAGRSFLITGQPSLAAIAIAMTIWGTSALVSVIGEHVGNYNITIHNLGVALSGVCHLTGALIPRRSAWRRISAPGAWLALGIAGGLYCVGGIWVAALENWLPPFFIEGTGATALRTWVLGLSIAMYAIGASLTWANYRSSGWQFQRWYALGLALLAWGALGLILQPTHGSALGWVARTTQYIGGLYMLFGTVLTLLESPTWLFSLEERLQRTERVQRKQAELIRNVNDNTSELIFMKDRAGRLTYANAATLRMVGKSALTPDMRDRELFHESGEYEPISENDQRVMATGETVEAEEVFTGADGKQRVFLSTKSALRDEDGSIVGVIGVSRDITERQQQARALREYAELIDLAHDAILVRSPAGAIASWSQGASRMYGFTREDALGSVSHELLRTVFPAPLTQIEAELDSRGWWEGKLIHTRRDGSAVSVNSRWTMRRIAPNQAPVVLEISSDISQRMRVEAALQQSEQQLGLALSAAEMGTWRWDLARDEISWDQRTYGIFGVESLEFKPTRAWLDDVIDPEDAASAYRKFEEACRGDGRYRTRFRLRRPDGALRWLSNDVLIQRDANGEPRTLVGTVKDITEAVQAEQGMRDADRRKDEFLATLAHELRGPLAPLRNMLEVMKRTQTNAEVLDKVRATMDRQLFQLVRLVDDLIDVSRITQNRMELRRQRVELASLLEQAIEACAPLTEQANHRVTFDMPSEPVQLNADAVRLVQVFSNILNNACKYTPRGGSIKVAAHLDGDHIAVSIKDSGIGIPKEQLRNVFELFMQIDRSPERSRNGLGIGLTLVKRLVEMHEGSVTARSDGLGHGCELVVRLPVWVSASESVTGPGQRSGAVQSRRILVVDDDVDTVESLAMLLRMNGHAVETATDGPGALAAAESYRPDVLLLDIGLPGLTGYDVCLRTREHDWGKDILIVALSGWGQEQDLRRSREAGFDVHLVKPVEYDALMSVLQTVQRPERCAALSSA